MLLNKNYGGAALAKAVEDAYARGETDYSLEPMHLEDADANPIGRIKDDDGVIFCCRRGEREIELTCAFTDPDFSYFPREFLPNLKFAIMTMYHERFKNLPIAFAPEKVVNPLSQVISKSGLRQYHLAESEKFAHVTFFFNGGAGEGFAGETDECVPSPKGVAFDKVPKLSLEAVSQKLYGAMSDGYDFILTNFANGDVIGHTSSKEAKLEAVACVADTLFKTVEKAKEKGYFVIVTADHGNIEDLYTPKGTPHGAHTANPVPFIVVDPENRPVKLNDGKLADVSPTVLDVLGLDKPPEMTGASLITGGNVKAKKVLLIVLDGWGFGSGDDKDAIFLGDTGKWRELLNAYPSSRLSASGEDVGLQSGKPGNSEAGHMNLGAGRVVTQDDVRMDKAISDGSFENNPVFLDIIERTRNNGSSLHLLSYLTHKSSHGCIEYPLALLKMARGIENVYLHIIFDGRSTPPGSAPQLLRELDDEMSKIGRGLIVDGVGRGIALDRDGNYDKIRRAYECMVLGRATGYRL